MSQDQAPETREAYLSDLAQRIGAINLDSLKRDQYGWPDFRANEPNLPPVQAFHQLSDDEAEIVLGLLFPEEQPGQDLLYPTPPQLLERIDRGLVILPETSGHLALPQAWVNRGYRGEAGIVVDQQAGTVNFAAVLPGEDHEFEQTLKLDQTQGLRQAMTQDHEPFWQFMASKFPQWNWPVGQPPDQGTTLSSHAQG